MTALVDMTGKRCGRLTVVGRAPNNRFAQSMWVCRCECGNERTIRAGLLRSGNTKSCGCLQSDLTTRRNRERAAVAPPPGNAFTQEWLKSILVYDPLNGEWRWIASRCARAMAGEVAGSTRSDGYKTIRFAGKNVLQHKLAFFYVTGSIPAIVDHRDGNRSNCAWDNLRAASRSQNAHNSKRKPQTKSGIRGVVQRGRKWVALIQANGVRIKIGSFATKEQAAAAYTQAAKEHFGEFSR